MRPSLRRPVLAPIALLAGFLACSSTERGFYRDPDRIGQDDADAGPEPEAPSCAGHRCSADLHMILDGCTGQVVQECATGMGCYAGKCTTACESASNAQGSVGCSFWTTPADTIRASQGSCFAAFIANTWNTPVAVEAAFGDTPLDLSKSIYRAVVNDDRSVQYQPIEGPIPPGEIGIVFLAESGQIPGAKDYVACPNSVNVAYRGDVVTEHATSLYKAFHLSTDAPVAAYSIFPYGGARSYVPAATLLLPSSSWGTNYVLVDGWPQNTGSPFVQIVAQEDDTEVRIRPNVDVLDGVRVSGGPRGSVTTWNLKRGQVLEFIQKASLAGSPLEATKPVAVFGGNQCVLIPDGRLACDTLHQQIPPLQQWASRYSAVPYKSRRTGIQGSEPAPENVYYRLAGAREGTELSYEPAMPVGAPAKLTTGQVVDFSSTFPFTVKSQDGDHPIYLAVYMSGSTTYDTLGDPDFVNVIPDEQFLDRYVFFVDHTYADSTITVVRRKDQRGMHDVTLECFGALTDWRPLGNDGSVEYTWLDLTKRGKAVETPKGTCSYGRHEARSDGPFSVYVWGMDSDASYGFPAGAGSRPTTPYKIEVR